MFCDGLNGFWNDSFGRFQKSVFPLSWLRGSLFNRGYFAILLYFVVISYSAKY